MAGTDLTTMSVPEVPGVYGNQYQLQLDVSRSPRVEQYQQVLTEESATSITDIPSDLKTVTYFVQVPAALPGAVPVAGASTGALSDLTDPQANGIGLVRRELDRAVTSAAMASGNTAGIISGGDLLAPEVAGIEFRYFDGIEWRLEWDTSVEKKLPLAIQILLALTSPDRVAEVAGQLGSGLTAEGAPVRLYTMVVHLPTGGQPSAEEEATVDATGTSTAGATGTGMTGGGATP